MMDKVEGQAYDLTINIDGLTIGDLERLERPESTAAFIDLLQKAVVNVDIRTLPLGAIPAIARAIRDEIGALRHTKA